MRILRLSPSSVQSALYCIYQNKEKHFVFKMSLQYEVPVYVGSLQNSTL